MIARTRVSRQLKGYRDRKPADLDAIALTLVHLSELICDCPEVAELDINPLLADENGVIAVDARVKIMDGPRPDRMAIRPYPEELARAVPVPGLGDFMLRPVRPEDAPAFERFFARLSPEDIHMRFFTSLKVLPPTMLARLTQIDYDREMALVLFDATGDVAGVVRLAADPDNARAEFAVLVRSDLKGHGVGKLLMTRLADYARGRGIGALWGDILPENRTMLALCGELGLALAPSPQDPAMTRATLEL